MITLDPAYLDEVKLILSKHLPNHSIWAFGSRVTGHAHDGSDLDLVAISTSAPEIATDLSKCRAAFAESNIPIMIDILDWAMIPDSFRQRIKQHAVVLL